MEARIFRIKQKYLKRFQISKVQSWHRIRIGRLVIEVRRITEPEIYKVKTPPECSLDGAVIVAVLERRLTIEKVTNVSAI